MIARIRRSIGLNTPLMIDAGALLAMAALASWALGLPGCWLAGVGAAAVFVVTTGLLAGVRR